MAGFWRNHREVFFNITVSKSRYGLDPKAEKGKNDASDETKQGLLRETNTLTVSKQAKTKTNFSDRYLVCSTFYAIMCP